MQKAEVVNTYPVQSSPRSIFSAKNQGKLPNKFSNRISIKQRVPQKSFGRKGG